MLETIGSGGPLARVALVALAWTVAACLGNLGESILALVRFSREGPVMPPLLPQLELKWVAAEFRLALWRWLRRFGQVVQFGALVWAWWLAGLEAIQVLRAGLVSRSWNEELAATLRLGLGCTVLFIGGVLVTLVLGGLAMLLVARASNYVRASNALVTREDVERVRRMLERLERDSDRPVADISELESADALEPEQVALGKSEDWPS